MPIFCGIDFALGLNAQARDVKSDGRARHKTRLQNSDRAERLGNAMAVALLWMVTLGGEQETISSDENLGVRQKLPELIPTRHISCFLNGKVNCSSATAHGSVYNSRSLASQFLQS